MLLISIAGIGMLICMSCSRSLFPGYDLDRSLDNAQPEPETWFSQDTGHYLFNTGIDVMKRHFSGLMVVKQTAKDTFRVIMITEVGLKVMDLEFFPSGAMKVHYIMDPMNKKMLIKTLSQDISMILMNSLEGRDNKKLRDRKNNLVFRYRFGRKKIYYKIEEGFPGPVHAWLTKGFSKKVHADFYGKLNKPDSVKIEHDNFALSITLNRIEETSHADE